MAKRENRSATSIVTNCRQENTTDNNGKKDRGEARKPLNDWVKYSTLGMEMAVVVAAFVVGGVMLDRRAAMRFPLFTLMGTALGLTIGMLRLVRAGKLP